MSLPVLGSLWRDTKCPWGKRHIRVLAMALKGDKVRVAMVQDGREWNNRNYIPLGELGTRYEEVNG